MKYETGPRMCLHSGPGLLCFGLPGKSAVQEGDDLSPGARLVGGEGGAVAGSGGDIHINRPGHSRGVVQPGGNIAEGELRLSLWHSAGLPQVGDHQAPGAGSVGLEGIAGHQSGFVGPQGGLVVELVL